MSLLKRTAPILLAAAALLAPAAADAAVRVLLGSRNGSVRFRASASACGHKLNSPRRYSFAAGGGSIELRDSDGKRITGCGGEGKAGGGVLIDGFGRFRGQLVAHADG